MEIHKVVRYLLLVGALNGLAYSQNTPSIAVLTFKGDQNVSPQQLEFITGKFTSELVASGAFKVLDRSRMDVILAEQGFQQSGACNGTECQMQIGQLLGVDNLVAGNMVRFGKEYAFHLEYIDVGTGQIQKTVELSERGELEDVYKTVCSKGAEQLVIAVRGEQKQEQAKQALPKKNESRPLSTKRKLALGLWGTGLAGAGTGIYFNQQMVAAGDDYDAAISGASPSKVRAESAYDDLQSATTGRKVSYGVSIGSVVLGSILWFWPEGGN